MKLTRRQALEETIALFEKLAAHARRGKIRMKSEIPGPWKEKNYIALCPCCEYDNQRLEEEEADCSHCPMKGFWIGDSCMSGTSPFVRWLDSKDRMKEGQECLCLDVEFFCLLIADLAREALDRSTQSTR